MLISEICGINSSLTCGGLGDDKLVVLGTEAVVGINFFSQVALTGILFT